MRIELILKRSHIFVWLIYTNGFLFFSHHDYKIYKLYDIETCTFSIELHASKKINLNYGNFNLKRKKPIRTLFAFSSFIFLL